MNYDLIKALAKGMKVPTTSLLALAPQNDPFYVGTERDKTLARWFLTLWQTFGYSSGVHIRRMHYQIVSQDPPVKLPNGLPYENTDRCWDELNHAAKAARYLGYVDPLAFVDRRNDDPIVHLDLTSKRHIDCSPSTLDDAYTLDFPEPPSVPHYQIELNTPQRYHLEIWCEKSTMNDVLIPLVRRYQGVLVYGKGELSITLGAEAVERCRRTGKPVRIFYVSDFDPAGNSMPKAMARKLEHRLQQLELYLDAKLFPVVLTHEQVQAYHLPPTPIKDSERRKATFEAKYGEGAVELDALEALHPGELEHILRHELDRYYDHTLRRRLYDTEQQLEQELERTQSRVLAPYERAIEQLDDEWQAIRTECEARIVDHMTQRLEIWEEIRQALDLAMPSYDESDLPEAEEVEERDGALFDSSRDYLTQNEVYQSYKSNGMHAKSILSQEE